MKKHFPTKLTAGFLMLVLTGIIIGAKAQNSGSAQAMKSSYQALQAKLSDNPFGAPIWIDSREVPYQAHGSIYSILHHPYTTTRQSLSDSATWCDILFLHMNVKYCKAIDNNHIQLYAGTKKPQSLDSATRMTYRFKQITNTPEYMQIAMTAEKGPYGTSSYNIMMEAIPLNTSKTFIHISYGYHYGKIADFAMKTYLSTAGREKEGLTIIGKKEDGSPEYSSGMKGIIERNILRYYLAIETYLNFPQAKQAETRMSDWFDATERYPQLHEITKEEYMRMKREEYDQMLHGPQKKNFSAY